MIDIEDVRRQAIERWCTDARFQIRCLNSRIEWRGWAQQNRANVANLAKSDPDLASDLQSLLDARYRALPEAGNDQQSKRAG